MAEPNGTLMPSNYDDETSLLGDLIDQRNFYLGSNIDDLVTTIPVQGSLLDIQFPVYVRFNTGEIFFAEEAGVDNKSFINVLRGVRGSTAASHTAGEAVYLMLSGVQLNQFRDAIIGGQKYQGLVGLDSALPASPDLNEVYIATDTEKVYVCLSAGSWTWVGGRETHSELQNLLADDHTQYHNDTRASTWHSGLTGGHVIGGDSHDHGDADMLGAGRIQSGTDAGKSDPPSWEREIWYATDTELLYISRSTTLGDWLKITGAPPNAIVMFTKTDITNLWGGSCPSGWTEYTAGQGKYFKGAPAGVTSPLNTGGALTHSHTYTAIPNHSHTIASQSASIPSEGSHTHAINKQGATGGNGLGQVSSALLGNGGTSDGGNHSHTFDIPEHITGSGNRTSDNAAGVATGTTETVNHEPPYQEMVFCQKD